MQKLKYNAIKEYCSMSNSHQFHKLSQRKKVPSIYFKLIPSNWIWGKLLIQLIGAPYNPTKKAWALFFFQVWYLGLFQPISETKQISFWILNWSRTNSSYFGFSRWANLPDRKKNSIDTLHSGYLDISIRTLNSSENLYRRCKCPTLNRAQVLNQWRLLRHCTIGICNVNIDQITYFSWILV